MRTPSPIAPFSLRRSVALSPCTSLGVGGPSDWALALAQPKAQLPQTLAFARQEGLALLVLGFGTNVLIADAGHRGLTLWCTDDAMNIVHEPTGLRIQAAAGADFCALVAETVAHGSYGLVGLSGIPGSAGAAPVQNIGAYGQALSDHLVGVEVVDIADGQLRRLAASELGLGYRTSHFKGAWQGRYIITAIELFVPAAAEGPPAHAQLQAVLEVGQHAPSPVQVAEAVLALRRDKGMLWSRQGPHTPPLHAGSFFTNPIVAPAVADGLAQALPGLPRHADAAGIKLSAAHLIEAAGFSRGWRDPRAQGRTGLSPRHALALSNFGGASAAELAASAQHIAAGVLAHSGVMLQPEPRWVGF